MLTGNPASRAATSAGGACAARSDQAGFKIFIKIFFKRLAVLPPVTAYYGRRIQHLREARAGHLPRLLQAQALIWVKVLQLGVATARGVLMLNMLTVASAPRSLRQCPTHTCVVRREQIFAS